MDKLNTFQNAAIHEVENHSIYVWGASGQYCKDITEKWIRSKEAKNDGGKHADEAVAAWKKVMASPYRDVARAFDCSGFISDILKQAGLLTSRRDCDGLYARCEPTSVPENGTLLFRVSASNPNDETHVGTYIDGKQYHSKGRAYGVVGEPYNKSYWAKMGWFKGMPHEQPEPQPTPDPQPTTHQYVKVLGGSVRVRAGNGTNAPCIGIAHRCDFLPYYGQADASPFWYEVEYRGQRAFITSNSRYTEVVYKA